MGNVSALVKEFECNDVVTADCCNAHGLVTSIPASLSAQLDRISMVVCVLDRKAEDNCRSVVILASFQLTCCAGTDGEPSARVGVTSSDCISNCKQAFWCLILYRSLGP